MSIQILAPDVVDRIAAGEVLERPANLIKELLENSIDAGATEVEVAFDKGGRDVVIRDNGSGMSSADLKMALKRHATSKITASEDLYRLHSFGFRGEALASVAAVSRVHLTSRPPGAEQGARLSADFGRAEDPVPVSAQTGTEVRVQDLFENVPARLRFLKSESAEHAQIKTTLKAMALAHPEVGVRVRCRGELIFHWAAGQSFLERALEILPVKRLFAGEATVEGVTADVLVGSPDETVRLNRNVWLFVQGRWVQDRGLTAAVMEAHRNLLMHGEYPVAAVRLTLAPEEVDVNVHPTKAQVRFRDPSLAFRAVCRAVRGVLERAPWLDGAAARPVAPLTAPEPPPPSSSYEAGAATLTTLGFSAPEFDRVQFSGKSFPLAQTFQAPAPAAAPTPAPTPQVFKWADLQVVGQLNHTYLVAQSAEAFYLVDQHAAHERVMFERLMTAFREGRMDVQNLLLPLVFDFSLEEVEALHAHRDEVEKLGLSVERMGPGKHGGAGHSVGHRRGRGQRRPSEVGVRARAKRRQPGLGARGRRRVRHDGLPLGRPRRAKSER